MPVLKSYVYRTLVFFFVFFFFLTNSFLARRLAVAATGVATVDLTPNRTKSLNPKLDFVSVPVNYYYLLKAKRPK